MLSSIGIIRLRTNLHWEQNHFVVLYKVDKKKRRFHIADPARGKITYGEEKFNSFWIAPGEGKGIAIVTESKEGFKEQQFDRDDVFRRFMGYLYHFLRIHKLT